MNIRWERVENTDKPKNIDYGCWLSDTTNEK